ncbi:MAG: hypothetical protein QM692_14205 [Thermomicrobiales bacterium]
MVAAKKNWEEQPLAFVTQTEAAPTAEMNDADGKSVAATSPVRKMLNDDERREIGRRVIAERQRMMQLLEEYDSRQ